MRAFLFYIDDWLSSKHVARMDAAEERGYLRLLLYAATEPDCGLPVDEDELANISLLGAQWHKPTVDESKRLKGQTSGQKVLAAFVRRGDRFFNERLLKEFNHQKEVSEKRAAVGRKGGLAEKHPSLEAIGKQLVKQTGSKTEETTFGLGLTTHLVDITSQKSRNDTSPGWTEIVTSATEARMVVDPSADSNNPSYREWQALDFTEKKSAVDGIRARVAGGQYADPAYVPALKVYLREKQWRASLRPRPNARGPDRKAAATEEFRRRMLQEMEENAQLRKIR